MGHAVTRHAPGAPRRLLWILATLCGSTLPTLLATSSVALLDAPHAQAQAERAAPSADDDRRARELFLLGDRLYEEGRYEASVTAFTEAYRLSHRPLLLFNLANAEERLGRLDAAAQHLREYLPHAADSERDVVRARIESIEERAAAAAAAAQADGADGTSGADGAQGATEDGTDDGTDDGAGSGSTGAVEPPPSHALRGAAIASLAVGGALVATGVTFGFLARSARDDARAACPSVDGARVCSTDARGPLDRDRRDSLIADLGVGIGLAAVATGVALWLLDEEPEAPAVAPAVSANGRSVGVWVHGRF